VISTGGVERLFDPRLGAHQAVVLAAHVATVAAVAALALRSAARRIQDAPNAGAVTFLAALGLDLVLLYFAAAFAAVGAAHVGAHLPLHWLLARCAVTDRRKLYAVRLGAVNEREHTGRRCVRRLRSESGGFRGERVARDASVAIWARADDVRWPRPVIPCELTVVPALEVN